MAREEFDLGDLARLKALIQMVCCSSVTEFELVHGDLRVTIKRRGNARVESFCCPPQEQVREDESAAPPVDEEECLVLAPLAGTVYLRPSPAEKPYADEGDMVEEGQVVALIEAMKMFNEVCAVTSGRISKLLVGNGQSVAAGDPIMRIALCARPTPCY